MGRKERKKRSPSHLHKAMGDNSPKGEEGRKKVKITVNPNAEVTGFGYAEPGEYALRVVKVEQKIGKKAPYLHWEFEFTDPTVVATDGKSRVGHIFENTTLSNDAQFALRAIVEGLGLAWVDFDTDECPGLELTAQVGTEEYEENIRNTIKRVVK